MQRQRVTLLVMILELTLLHGAWPEETLRPFRTAEKGPSPAIAAARADSQIMRRFNQLTRGIYPQSLITQMQGDGYDPYIIGYSHGDLSNVEEIKRTFERIRQWHPNQTIKVAFEIAPRRFLYVKDFLRDEREYQQLGTIKGAKPEAQLVEALQAYRPVLLQDHASHIALWLLENGFKVIPFFHEDIEEWIAQDEEWFFQNQDRLEKDGWVEEGSFDQALERLLNTYRPVLTAIRQDSYGLKLIARERPDVISVGTFHALKYDLLLDRDGRRSFYFRQMVISWDMILAVWEITHDLYRREFLIKGPRLDDMMGTVSHLGFHL